MYRASVPEGAYVNNKLSRWRQDLHNRIHVHVTADKEYALSYSL